MTSGLTTSKNSANKLKESLDSRKISIEESISKTLKFEMKQASELVDSFIQKPKSAGKKRGHAHVHKSIDSKAEKFERCGKDDDDDHCFSKVAADHNRI